MAITPVCIIFETRYNHIKPLSCMGQNLKNSSIIKRSPWRCSGGACGHMIPKAMLAVAYAAGSAYHARQVKGDDPDKKGYPGPPGCGLGEVNNPTP